MSALVVCLSREHGNTSALAAAIAEELGAEVVEPRQVTATMIAEHELIGFGSGIRFTRHYQDLLNAVDHLPQQPTTRAFVFSTSGVGTTMWHWALNRRLRTKGFDVIGQFCCKGLDTMGLLRLIGGLNKGRPHAADIDQARSFARGLSR